MRYKGYDTAACLRATFYPNWAVIPVPIRDGHVPPAFVSEMTYNVLTETFNPTHSLLIKDLKSATGGNGTCIHDSWPAAVLCNLGSDSGLPHERMMCRTAANNAAVHGICIGDAVSRHVLPTT